MDQLYRDLYQGVLRHVRRKVGSDELAEDITHDSFLRLWGSLQRGTAVHNAAAFVFRSANNRIIDHYRTNKAKVPYLDSGDDSQERERDEVGRTEVVGWMQGSVDALPEPYRTTLRMAEIEQLPYAQIAAQLDLSVAGVKSRVRRGRALIRERLLQCCRFTFDARGRVIDYESNAWRERNKRCDCTTGQAAEPAVESVACGCQTPGDTCDCSEQADLTATPVR